MPERLRRLEYSFQRLPLYFITTCTNERQPILNNLDVHARLIEFGKEGEEHGAWLGAYVLMPDHLHAFVAIDDERFALSSWIKSMKNALSKTLRMQGVPSPHWQKVSLITFCAAEIPTRRSGITFARTRCVQAWSKIGAIGHSSVKCSIWSFEMIAFEEIMRRS